MPGADDSVLQCISAHFLPEINHRIHEVDDMCRTIQDTMRGTRTIRLLGGDINVEMAEDVAGGPTISMALIHDFAGRRSLHQPWDREVKQNIRGWGMKVLNTFDTWWEDIAMEPQCDDHTIATFDYYDYRPTAPDFETH